MPFVKNKDRSKKTSLKEVRMHKAGSDSAFNEPAGFRLGLMVFSEAPELMDVALGLPECVPGQTEVARSIRGFAAQVRAFLAPPPPPSPSRSRPATCPATCRRACTGSCSPKSAPSFLRAPTDTRRAASGSSPSSSPRKSPDPSRSTRLRSSAGPSTKPRCAEC
ncbi:hypothetical protein DIPPA_22254 [Diplonema papillatum]|nr:hypothetical protein DIPPA_22254 [Diplonema papillatum]